MSCNDSFAGYLLFEIMMRVLNNKNRKNEKRCWHKRNGMILYLSCLWETVRNILFQRDLKKMFQKRIKKSSWQVRKNMIWCKSCCGSYEERVNKINQKVLDKLRTKWYNDKASYTKRITKKIFDNWTIRQPWKF